MILSASVVTLSHVQLLRYRANIRLVVDQDVKEDSLLTLLPNVELEFVHRAQDDPQKAHQIHTLQKRRIRVNGGLVVHHHVARIEEGLALVEARGPRVG